MPHPQPHTYAAASGQVLTYNRPKALLRLLQSLQASDYMNDLVALEVFVDGVREQDKGDALREEAVGIARSFAWTHGPKTLYLRNQNIGLSLPQKPEHRSL